MRVLGRALVARPRDERAKMGGFITKIEVLKNKTYIVKTWGLAFFELCLKSEGETFLGLLTKSGNLSAAA